MQVLYALEEVCALWVVLLLLLLLLLPPQVGYVFGSAGLSVCLFVGLLAILLKNLGMDFDEIFWKDWAWYK